MRKNEKLAEFAAEKVIGCQKPDPERNDIYFIEHVIPRQRAYVDVVFEDAIFNENNKPTFNSIMSFEVPKNRNYVIIKWRYRGKETGLFGIFNRIFGGYCTLVDRIHKDRIKDKTLHEIARQTWFSKWYFGKASISKAFWNQEI